jgi:methionine-rich copper-binding protein CopC
MQAMPWIVTFGPLHDDESWEPVVCGPYERAHALSLAETVVADENLLAVVEPVYPHASVEEIQAAINESIQAAQEAEEMEAEELAAEALEVAELTAEDGEGEVDISLESNEDEVPVVEATPPPSPDEIRAGFVRIANRIATA